MTSMLFKQHSSQPYTGSASKTPAPNPKRQQGQAPKASPSGKLTVRPKAHRLPSTIWKLGGLSWTVGVPTALGAVLGLWLDTLWPSSHSWFHILCPLGLFVGCLLAVLWGSQEGSL